VSQPNNTAKKIIPEPANNVQSTNESEVLEENIVIRSVRQKRPAILDDYVVYSLENECDLSIENDPV
jgi:hypothetical protein